MTSPRDPLRPALRSPLYDPLVGKWGGASALPAFAFEPEATTYIASLPNTPSARRQWHINDMFRWLKTRQPGALPKIIHAWLLVGDTKANRYKPVIGNITLTEVGTVTAVANGGMTVAATGNYLETGIVATALPSVNNIFVAIGTKRRGTNTTSDAGVIDGSGGIILNANANGAMSARCGGSSQGGAATDGFGMTFCDRNNSANYKSGASGQYSTITQASAAFSGSSTFQIFKIGGQSGFFSTSEILYVIIGQSMTDAERDAVYGAFQGLADVMMQGEPIMYYPGTQPQNVTSYDHIVYGATSMGVAAARELARKGETVCIVGGYGEHELGGMSAAGGLGGVDFGVKSAMGGLYRAWIERARAISGQSAASASFAFKPNDFLHALRETLDSTRSGMGTGYDIPIFWSGGVDTVTVVNKRVTSIRTKDGRTFTCKYFADCSYDSDLMAATGQPMFVGREAAGSSIESSGGYRGLLTTAESDEHQYFSNATQWNVDPYITPGVPASGLLTGILPLPAKTNGQADSEVQAFNYRVTMGNTSATRINIPSTAPANYNKARYEPLLRWMALDPGLSNVDVLLFNSLYGSCFDVNSTGGMGTDLWGSGTAYTACGSNYAARQVVIDDLRDYIKGLFYLMCHDPDVRVPAALRTAQVAYGWRRDHYLRPVGSEDMFFPYQAYVRRFRTMIGAYIHNANDLCAGDGTTPRSVKTISTVSYAIDRHHVQSYADPNGGTPRIWNEGGIFIGGVGGGDQVGIVPLEIILPDPAYIENGICVFGGSLTDMAVGPTRMEATNAQEAQSGGMVMYLARSNGEGRVHDINYATFAAEMAATPEAMQPVLPVLN